MMLTGRVAFGTSATDGEADRAGLLSEMAAVLQGPSAAPEGGPDTEAAVEVTGRREMWVVLYARARSPRTSSTRRETCCRGASKSNLTTRAFEGNRDSHPEGGNARVWSESAPSLLAGWDGGALGGRGPAGCELGRVGGEAE